VDILGLPTDQERKVTSTCRTKSYVESKDKIPALKTSVNVQMFSFVTYQALKISDSHRRCYEVMPAAKGRLIRELHV